MSRAHVTASIVILLETAVPVRAQAPTPSPSPKKETPSYTSDDLDRIAGRKPGEARPSPRPSPRGASAPSGSEDQPLTFDPNAQSAGSGERKQEGEDQDRGSWAERAQTLRDAAADAEAKVKDLDSQAQTLLWQYLQSTDTNEILRLKAEQQDILDQIPDAKKAVEDAQKALSDFEKEAARAGVPPGEIREKKKP